MKKDDILKKTNSLLGALKTRFNVSRIGLYGSYVRNEATPESDVDMLVEFSKPIGFFKFIDLENYLSRELGKEVDLVSSKALKSAIKKDVLREIQYV